MIRNRLVDNFVRIQIYLHTNSRFNNGLAICNLEICDAINYQREGELKRSSQVIGIWGQALHVRMHSPWNAWSLVEKNR